MLYEVITTDLTAKVAAQPLMKSLHQVLFNGYYVEAMITWFSRTIIVGAVAATANWIDRRIVDGAVNGSVPAARGIFELFGRTRGGKVGGYAGVITSYSIHYTKLYDQSKSLRKGARP